MSDQRKLILVLKDIHKSFGAVAALKVSLPRSGGRVRHVCGTKWLWQNHFITSYLWVDQTGFGGGHSGGSGN